MLLCWGIPEGYPEGPEELIVGPRVTARHIESERRSELQYRIASMGLPTVMTERQ